MNNKKSIIALLLVAIIGIVGLTIAYFSSEATIENEFQSSDYGTTVEEVFTSPDSWTPGTTTPKTLTVTNSGNVDEAVRVSYTESWTSANAQDEGDLALTQNGNSAAIINWANTSDWTTSTENGTTYKYYNYKLAPHETTSELLSSVTFNSAITNDENCVTSNNGQTIECTSTGNGYDGATYKLTFHIETVQYDKYEEAWGTEVEIAADKPLTGVNYLMANAKNADGAEYNTTTKTKMFKMTHPQTAQTPAQTEYRYIGDNPDNYVYFNCDSLDNQSASTCEVWRILGVFDVDNGTGNYEQRIKLVRGSALPDTKEWDDRTNEIYPRGNYTGKNEWEGSVIQAYLNDDGDYYKRTGTAANYGLKATAKSLISDAKYYLGGASYNNNIGYGTADAMYLWERGTKKFDYENYCLWYKKYDFYSPKCSSDYCENNPNDEICNEVRNLNWVGEVAIMYPSDYALVYSNEVNALCYSESYRCQNGDSGSYGNPSSNWIYNSNKIEKQNSIIPNWYISPSFDEPGVSFYFSGDGRAYYYYSNGRSFIRPVVYLSASVKILSGTGQSTDPYKLSL